MTMNPTPGVPPLHDVSHPYVLHEMKRERSASFIGLVSLKFRDSGKWVLPERQDPAFCGVFYGTCMGNLCLYNSEYDGSAATLFKPRNATGTSGTASRLAASRARSACRSGTIRRSGKFGSPLRQDPMKTQWRQNRRDMVSEQSRSNPLCRTWNL